VNYPLLDAFLTMMWLFIWILWFFLLFRVIIDIFRSHDLGGWGKAAWLFFVIIVPFLGVFVYIIARGGKMAEHDQKDIEAQQQAFNRQVQAAAGSDSSADQLTKLADLHSKGLLTDEEFAAQKAKILG
jgi:flagellar biosynthesis/type III secretory pathway M-ring protein FliF/YscJ